MNKKFLKKLTLHNIFIKWPKIFILDRIKEKTRNTFLRGLFFHKNPIIMTDKHSIRFVLYPWDKTSFEKLSTHRMFDIDFSAFKRIVRDGNMVFDIGANIGLHSTILSGLAGKSGILYSFEPVPNTFNLLNETMALNNNFNTKTRNIAFLDKIGKLSMNVFDINNSSLNSFGNPIFGKVKAIEKVDVEVDTIDNFCEKNKILKIDFMKVDVEGFEKSVFLGAKKMLGNKLVDCLSFEISQIPLQGNNTKAKEIFDILLSYGYKSYKYNMNTGKFEGPYFDSNDFYENYYASYNDLTKI